MSTNRTMAPMSPHRNTLLHLIGFRLIGFRACVSTVCMSGLQSTAYRTEGDVVDYCSVPRRHSP
ncbi:hypothetical protein NITHO_4750002 [Nitrolancea hollandica Lb]|uniref:Uncharacterized protein n=1 Tax=Nitrolancea hollandica Lb TaxID=1129897 RepID=I4EKR1_9BACT|nr:hypothetical protein NITHO_4750002 [Nitrolancea hollandica Lb]